MNSQKRIVIIGAGMAGIACALRLKDAGIAPVVYEKSNQLGGRMSTRVFEGGFSFDHGAQFFRAKGDSFAKFVSKLEDKNHASVWNAISRSKPTEKEHPMMVGVPAMNELLKPISLELDIQFGKRVETVEKFRAGYKLKIENSNKIEIFDYVVSTIPVAQARQLFHNEKAILDKCAKVSLLPCWAGLFGFKEKLNCDFDTWRHVNFDIGWIARNSSKPDRDQSKDCWVLHASPEWTLDNLERDKSEVAIELFHKFKTAMDIEMPQPEHIDAHRWRYAQTSEPLQTPFVTNDDCTVLVGGDWCLGARVEAAFDSGSAIADEILNKV